MLFSFRKVEPVVVQSIFYFMCLFALIVIFNNEHFTSRVNAVYSVIVILIWFSIPVYDLGLCMEVRKFIERFARIQLFVIQCYQSRICIQSPLAVSVVLTLPDCYLSIWI